MHWVINGNHGLLYLVLLNCIPVKTPTMGWTLDGPQHTKDKKFLFFTDHEIVDVLIA